jgi:hypothetical protein
MRFNSAALSDIVFTSSSLADVGIGNKRLAVMLEIHEMSYRVAVASACIVQSYGHPIDAGTAIAMIAQVPMGYQYTMLPSLLTRIASLINNPSPLTFLK